MSVLPKGLSSFTGPLNGMQMTCNEAIVERKISEIWKVLQETNNNLNTCDQLLEHYSSRIQLDGQTNIQDASTQTSLPAQLNTVTSSLIQNFISAPPYVDSVRHVATQTTFDQNEVTNTGIQTCILQDSATQTNSGQDVQSVGLQVQRCGCSLLNVKFDENSRKHWSQNRGGRLCHEHYEALKMCGSCEFQDLEDTSRDNKTTQTMKWEMEGHQKIVDCFSSLEQHCQDMDVRLGSVLSLLEVRAGEVQSSLTRVLNQETSREQHSEEKRTKAEELLTIEKRHRQRAEELLSVAQSNYAMQEMQVLNRRLVQLEETLAAERDSVVQLHESRKLLSAQIKGIKCSLVEERVSKDSLSHQTARLDQRNSRLRAQLSRSRAQYRSQLADARRMIGSRNAKVNQLRTALIKVRDLCHSIHSRYRTMLWEIGKQIQLTAELVARDCGLDWSEGPVITTLTAEDISEWYQQVWRTIKWIQLHILAHQCHVKQISQPEGNEADTGSNRPITQVANELCSPLSNVKADIGSPCVDGSNADLSLDLSQIELSLDISSPVRPTAEQRADLASTSCSSLSHDLHVASQDRYQMQHRFLTILDNLRVKLLQLKPNSVQ